MNTMNTPDVSTVEHAVLLALAGASLDRIAAQRSWPAEFLAEAVDAYRAAGREALAGRPAGGRWLAADIEFADAASARRAFTAYVLPPLLQARAGGLTGGWWFARRTPCWRLCVLPAPGVPDREVAAFLAGHLDSAVSWQVVTRWLPAHYEPATTACGGPAGLQVAHALFEADSAGVLAYLHATGGGSTGVVDAKAVSLLLMTVLLRAAGQDREEQGDVWARVERLRPLDGGIPSEQVVAAAHRVLVVDTAELLAGDGPLAPFAAWTAGLAQAGRQLAAADREALLTDGLRSVLARHVVCHWNRMGFGPRQQAVWARAAREALLGA
ncbi:thiopeptide-type bacteriocin biosynthesis protein [Streptomyces sp. NPDC089919]|uniref:thiopeptide-type bacteriocin biosynthesis protein n=1 Tax=Streptomyces sp. NPDC089919 TaxID=3155188 RepID=UPI003443889D